MPTATIIPVLHYADVDQAITWLCRTFGFSLRWRVGNHRAQLSFGNGAIAISEQSAGHIANPARHSLLVRVPDVQSHFEHAAQMKALIVQSPVDYPYGEKQYGVEDPGGHLWTFSESIANMSPEEWGATTGKLD